MLCGEESHTFAISPRDVTYASSLPKVLKNIDELIGGEVSMSLT